MPGGVEERWERFWFASAPLARLGAFRIVLLATAFHAVWRFRPGVLQHADGLDPALLARSWRPIFALELFGIGPPGPLQARALLCVTVAAIALGIAGLWARLSCALAALGTLLWCAIAYSWGKPHHDCVALVFGLLALPLAPVGARLSADAWRARLRRARRGEDPAAMPREAPWALLPLRVVQVTAALGYFFAGASKLARSGPGWADGYTLQGIMIEYESPWSQALASHVGLCAVLSAGLLLVQTSFPLVFLHRSLRWLYVPMAVAFHLVAMQTMATGPFLTLWLPLAAFVDLERVPAFLRRLLLEGSRWRRLAAGTVLGAAALVVLRLYFAYLPPLLPLFLLPLLATLALATRRGGLVLSWGAADPRAARRMATLAALDWAGRLRFERRAGADEARLVRGTRLLARGERAWRAARAQLPLARLCAPWTALAVERGEDAPQRAAGIEGERSP